MKKEIVFIDDDTLTSEELAMLSDEFGVEFVTEKTEETAVRELAELNGVELGEKQI